MFCEGLTRRGGAPPVDISSHVIQRTLGLPPPATRDLVIERDLPVPMADGAVLLADRWAPRAGSEGLPAALLRTPYGRRGLFGRGDGQAAGRTRLPGADPEHPGHVRLRWGFDAMRCERDDGLATLQWLVKQPWLGGAIILCGPATWATRNGRWPMACRPRSRR